MEYKRVGASGLRISELALGTQNFAMSVDEKTAGTLVDAFIDAGGHVTITGTRPAAADYEADLSRFDYRQLHLQSNEEIGAVADSLDALDVLVNNAGGVLFAEPGKAVQAFEEMVRVHLLSAHHMSEACYEKLALSELPSGASDNATMGNSGRL